MAPGSPEQFAARIKIEIARFTIAGLRDYQTHLAIKLHPVLHARSSSVRKSGVPGNPRPASLFRLSCFIL